MRYILVREKKYFEFIEEVQRQLDKGFVCQGGVSTVFYPDPSSRSTCGSYYDSEPIMYTQAMIKQ